MFSISFINLPTAHSFHQIENFAAVARNYVCDIALSYHVLQVYEKKIHVQRKRVSTVPYPGPQGNQI